MARRSLISPAQLSKVLSKIAFNKAEDFLSLCVLTAKLKTRLHSSLLPLAEMSYRESMRVLSAHIKPKL